MRDDTHSKKAVNDEYSPAIEIELECAYYSCLTHGSISNGADTDNKTCYIYAP